MMLDLFRKPVRASMAEMVEGTGRQIAASSAEGSYHGAVRE